MLQLKKEQKDFSVFNDNCENSLIEILYKYFNLNGSNICLFSLAV